MQEYFNLKLWFEFYIPLVLIFIAAIVIVVSITFTLLANKFEKRFKKKNKKGYKDEND